jgi:hypothetical protein
MSQKTTGVTAAALAVHLGLTQTRIAQLAAEGVIPKPPSGGFDLDTCRLAYLNWLRDPSRRAARSEAASSLIAAKAFDIEVRTKQRLNRLVPIEVYDEMIDDLAGMVRSEFAGLAAACTRDLTMRRIIDREVNARLRRIAELALAKAIRLEAEAAPAGGEPAQQQG